MRRLIVATTTALLALPATALAAAGSGVVLSVDARHHTIEVVDSHHQVHAYRYRGRLPKLHAGSRISWRASGATVGGVKAGSNGSRTVTFLGKVVRSSNRSLAIRLADGRTVNFSSKQVRRARSKSAHHRRHGPFAAAANVTISISGLEPGVTVLITETVDGHGNVTILITFPGGSATSAEQQARGVITEVDADTFMLETSDGSDLRLHMAQDALANLNLNVCDAAAVTYH